MGQILHGSATTTHAVRTAIQRSKASVAELAAQYHLNPKTVRKWRKRSCVEDMPMGPKDARSTVLSAEEEAACVAFRKHTLLPLDDCLYALQATISSLTRSSLHRLFQRHGISRLPDLKDEAEPKRKFKSYPIGYFHIDIAEVRTEEGKLHMFVAIDRTSKFAFVQLYERATRAIASQFLRDLVTAIPYRIHTVLTDNGVQFCHPGRYRDGPTATMMGHLFDRVCAESGIEHRLTKPNHPWTNGQVERMNRTLKEATVKRYHYGTHDQLRQHLQNFVDAYNYAKRLKTLRGLTPFEHIVKCWTEKPKSFKLNPTHYMPGLNRSLGSADGRYHQGLRWRHSDDRFIGGAGSSTCRQLKKSDQVRSMGRSRGGLTTKIHALTDARGLPIKITLTPGQTHDLRGAEVLLKSLGEGDILLADKAYDANDLRQKIEAQGAAPNIPDKATRKEKHCFSKRLYKERNLVERFFNKIKHFRRIATRFEKLAENYLAMIKLASIRIWMRHNESMT